MVVARFGLAVPFSVAEVLVRKLTALVVTAGGSGVVNESSEPNPVPTLLEAMAQTKYVVPGESPATGCG